MSSHGLEHPRTPAASAVDAMSRSIGVDVTRRWPAVFRSAGCLDRCVFFSWTACDDRGSGAGGVTALPGRATELLSDALVGLGPGASGFVRLVRLHPFSWPSQYVHGKVLLRVVRDQDTGETLIVGGE
jgi:hypothetical protein